MGKIIIPEGLTRKDRIAYVVGNANKFLDFKKSLALKYSDPFCGGAEVVLTEKAEAIKSFRCSAELPNDAVRVKAVANTAFWMDSQADVLLPDCWKKSISENKRIKHLREHKHSFDAEIGKVREMYGQTMKWRQLGIDLDGTTQALMMESDVMKSLDPAMYERYKNEEVDQHSIGLKYVKISLAIDDKGYEKGYELYQKWIDQIGNKSEVEEQGFFFAVPEIKVFENSAVLFGSNELTPTLEVYTGNQPQKSTDNQPHFDAASYIKNYDFKL